MEWKRRRVYFIPIVIAAVILLLGFVVMSLWNAILPQLLNVRTITYGQALGIFILCKILFSSFRPGPPHGFRRGGPPWRSKWMNLTTEEREKFRREWQKRDVPKDEA
jgi:hypothetical protein